jgi:hypothetical protein
MVLQSGHFVVYWAGYINVRHDIQLLALPTQHFKTHPSALL